MPKTEKQKFVDEQLRPLCEAIRAINVRIEAMKTDWEAGKNALFSNDNTPYVDGRDGEGLTPMVESEIFDAAKVLLGCVATSNTGRQVYDSQMISKPCVRPLEAN